MRATGPAAVAPCFQGSRPSTVSSFMEGTMDSASFFISPNELWALIGTGRAPQLFDTRRREVYDAAPAFCRARSGATSPTSNTGRPNSTATARSCSSCRMAHQMSQIPAAHLRERRLRRPRAGRRLCGLERSQAAAGRQSRARPLRAATAEPVGHPAAAEDRPRRLSVADPPLHRRRRRAFSMSIRIRFSRPPRKTAPSRSTSRASKFPTKASAARSTPC